MRLGAAAAGLGVTGSMAGCSAVQDAVPFLGGGASYTQWLGAPGTLNDDADHYSFSFRNYQTVRNNEDNFDSDVYEGFEDAEDSFPLDPMDVDLDEVNSRISGNGAGIIQGSFNADDVGSELEDNDFDEDGDHKNYTIYVKEESQGVAVKNNVAIHVSLGFYSDDDAEPADMLETVIDVKTGEEDRYTNEEEDFQLLTNRLGSGAYVSGGTQEEIDDDNANATQGRFEGTVASGSQMVINGETSKLKGVNVFNSADDVDMDDVEEYVEENEFLDEFDNVSSNQNGRTVIVTGEIDTDDELMSFLF